MNLTRRQKEQEFIDEIRRTFKKEEIGKEFYCKECNKQYKGHELWLGEGYGSIGSKYYVTMYYYCPKNHVIKSIKSKELKNTFVDNLFSLLIIIVIVIIVILLFKFCPSDLPPIKYK